jgi:murein DD-endopeptidase MepM/ murein hydrolase activator NlpD
MMKRYPAEIVKKTLTAALVIYLACGFLGRVLAVDSADVRGKIDQKNRELELIKNQIAGTENKIDELSAQGNTLKRELSSIDYEVKQLDLGIRSSEVNIEKLGLELEDLDNRLATTKTEITGKREAIAQLIKEIYQADKEGMLIQFLRGKSLADTVFDLRTIEDFQNNLMVNVVELNDLVGEIDGNIRESTEKKSELKIEQQTLINRQGIAKETKTNRQNLLTLTKNQEKIYQTELTKLEKRRAETEAEIGQYEEELRIKIDPTILPGIRSGVLGFPVPGGRITQDYGRTAFALRAYLNQWHNGIDIGRYLGAEIVAAESGEVIAAGNQDFFCRGVGYGNYVVIRHDNNLTTLYSHFSRYIVKKGDRVNRGQLIGYMGKTGWSTGPHLHFTVYSTATYILRQSKFCGPTPIGGDINPMNYL